MKIPDEVTMGKYGKKFIWSSVISRLARLVVLDVIFVVFRGWIRIWTTSKNARVVENVLTVHAWDGIRCVI
jgi:hypothetical protein